MSMAEQRISAAGDEVNIVCGCAALSLAELRSRIAGTPHLAFEDLLAAVGAGTKCTACLLDLEFHFVEAQQGRGGAASPDRVQHARPRERTSLKQRIYAFLDRNSPRVAYRFNNSMPVLFGPDVEQWLWIVNHSMLFEGRECAPTMRIDLIIRDKTGRTVATSRNDVKAETTLRYNLSTAFEALPEAGRIGIGSVEIRRRGLRPGIRGTTRPQIEILTPHSACAVHSQAMTGPGQYWFTCLSRAGDERMFFSLLNGAGRQTTIELSYPIGAPGIEPDTHRITLPARGAALHEMKLPPTAAGALGDAPLSVTWRATVPHKVHAICASLALDRFSIDHL